MTNRSRNLCVADKISELINNGVFPPGTKLTSAQKLGNRFGVSRQVVREAQFILQGKGILDVKPYLGVFVVKPDDGINSYVDSLDLLEAQGMLMAEVAALATQRIEDKKLDELEQFARSIFDNSNAESSVLKLCGTFHSNVSKSTKNREIMLCVDRAWSALMRSGDLAEIFLVESVQIQKDLIEIVQAMKAFDVKSARHLTKQHFSKIIELVIFHSEARSYRQAKETISNIRTRFLLSDIGVSS